MKRRGGRLGGLDPTDPKRSRKMRRIERKENRKRKKQHPKKIIAEEKPEDEIVEKKAVQSKLNTIEKEILSQTKAKTKLKKSRKRSKKELLEQNEDEDVLIKKLEKRLGVKNKSK